MSWTLGGVAQCKPLTAAVGIIDQKYVDSTLVSGKAVVYLNFAPQMFSNIASNDIACFCDYALLMKVHQLYTLDCIPDEFFHPRRGSTYPNSFLAFLLFLSSRCVTTGFLRSSG